MSDNGHTALAAALRHLERGDWQAAHKIVQQDESPAGCWLHGVVHVLEGDLDNARYWYGRAHRVFSANTAMELAAAKKSVL